MIQNLSENAQKIYLYLQSIQPEGATNSEIEEATRIHPHAQVFQLTRKLTEQGLLRASRGQYGEREWVFHFQTVGKQSIMVGVDNKSGDYKNKLKPETLDLPEISPKEFEQRAARIMSEHYGVSLHEGGVAGVPKRFDLVSKDGTVVGDAKYCPLVRGTNNPSAKFSVIAEHVWLLEKSQAIHKFLVFGNQREVPIKWLMKYAHLATAVSFFFIDGRGNLEKLM